MDFPNTSVPLEENIFEDKKKAFVGIAIFLLFVFGIFFYLNNEKKEVLTDQEKIELLGSLKPEYIHTDEEVKEILGNSNTSNSYSEQEVKEILGGNK